MIDIGDTYKVGEGGHYPCENQHNFNLDLSHKIRLKVLQGRFDPDPKDGPMLRKFRASNLTPEEFLKTWKG